MGLVDGKYKSSSSNRFIQIYIACIIMKGKKCGHEINRNAERKCARERDTRARARENKLNAPK